MKIKELFKRLTPSFLCAHANKHSVIIRDYYYDEMTDNDDLDDIPTLIKVTYCYDCGKILKKEYFDNYNYFNYSQHLSNNYEMKEFYKRCKIAYRNEVTLYDNKLRKNYYGQI